MRNFKHRDLAFHYAAKFNARIIVHNKDGTIDFTFISSNK